jgi:transcriptional regulator GlxA family with amidase domain
MNQYRLSAGLATLLVASWGAPTQDQSQTEDKTRLRVAFVVSEQFNIIDFAGPWEVFNDAKLPIEGKQRGDWPRLFENYTVSDSTSPVRTGGNHATLVPAFTFRNAPKPDIIVVGAQDSPR